MRNVGHILTILFTFHGIFRDTFAFFTTKTPEIPEYGVVFGLSSRKKVGRSHWGSINSKKSAKRNKAAEFFDKVLSNPVYEAREDVPIQKIPVKVINNATMKNLGRNNYENILEEIKRVVDERLKREMSEKMSNGGRVRDGSVRSQVPDRTHLESPGRGMDRDVNNLVISRHIENTVTCAVNNLKTERIFRTDDLLQGMRYRKLGESDLVVSEICIGTSMFDNPRLIDCDHAVEIMETGHKRYGINFFDTCEFDPYPYEPRSYLEGQHRSLRGFLKLVNREDVIISGRMSSSNLGKHRSSGRFLSWVRDDILSPPNLRTIERALDKFLERLGTDYIDILSFVYPYRYVPLSHLGEDTYCWSRERWLNEDKDRKKSAEEVGSEEELLHLQCEIFDSLIAKGKVRYVGLSNETTWGVFQMKSYLQRKFKLACTQQLYNILHRNEVESSGLSEACLKEHLNCPIVAYGVLAGGILTGKYLDPQRHNPMGADKLREPTCFADLEFPEGSEMCEDYGHLNFGPANARCNIYPDTYHTHRTVWCQHATAEYLKLARVHGMTLSQLSLSWALSRPFIASTIVGLRTIGQLHETISALSYRITRELEEDVHEVFLRYRAPTMGGPQILTRIENEYPINVSQNDHLRYGAIPIWSGGSHWDMDHIPSLKRIKNFEEHTRDKINVKRMFGLLDKPNDSCWPNYRCWVERINEGLPGEYFAVKESKLFCWDTMKLDGFTVVNKTPEEIAKDDTSNFHFYWRGGKVYVGETSEAIHNFYKDREAVFNVMKCREKSFLRAIGLDEPPEDLDIWSPLDADLVLKRLLEKYGINVLDTQELERLLESDMEEFALTPQERKCEKFAYFGRNQKLLETE